MQLSKLRAAHADVFLKARNTSSHACIFPSVIVFLPFSYKFPAPGGRIWHPLAAPPTMAEKFDINSLNADQKQAVQPLNGPVLILRQDIGKLGYKENFSIYTGCDQSGLLKRLIKHNAGRRDNKKRLWARWWISPSFPNVPHARSTASRPFTTVEYRDGRTLKTPASDLKQVFNMGITPI